MRLEGTSTGHLVLVALGQARQKWRWHLRSQRILVCDGGDGHDLELTQYKRLHQNTPIRNSITLVYRNSDLANTLERAY